VGAANLCDVRYNSTFRNVRSYEDWLDDGQGLTAQVGSYAANPFGLHDVNGNVWEWCRDWFGGYERECSGGDGLRAVGEDGSRICVYRGGSFAVNADSARSANRVKNSKDTRSDDVGLRAARFCR
jgi:formylglycine-generating enzyme required for sulfatase activity